MVPVIRILNTVTIIQ
ncbi:unnamed protein product, partial [Rotaria sp. Silwood1]